MIIDDEYCQYDTFRIINKADSDAIAAFKKDAEQITERSAREAELLKWQGRADSLKAEAEISQESEESVYQLTYAERMVQRWKSILE